MRTTTRAALLGLSLAAIALAATPKLQRLTPQRIFDLTALADVPPPKSCQVEIAGLKFGSATQENDPVRVSFPVDGKPVIVEDIREFRFPTEFDPPEAAANGAPVIAPTTPRAFETINAGWTIRLSARPQGKLVALYGVADYVEPELVKGGYGAVAGPIYSEKGELLAENKLDQPKVTTTTTRFHIFALPGQPYEVTFYRGAKTEKHTVKVTLE